MGANRVEKVAEVIKEEVSRIIHDDLKDPRIGFITITRVEMSKDCRYAKIYFSILGDEKEREKSLKGLSSATGYIKKLISERIDLRYIPEITFKWDSSIEHSIHIQETLDKLKENQPG